MPRCCASASALLGWSWRVGWPRSGWTTGSTTPQPPHRRSRRSANTRPISRSTPGLGKTPTWSASSARQDLTRRFPTDSPKECEHRGSRVQRTRRFQGRHGGGLCLRLLPVRGEGAGRLRGRPRSGKVSVIIGGGSGHYPAFCGTVGAGLADGAVIGDIFTSPSTEQAYRAGKALDGGAGVLFSFGNYAGDVMNFGVAQERLRAEGIDCRTVLVTDDVASAPAEQGTKRRGVVGDFVVFKIAGAAADRGDDLDRVETLARKANAATISFGVAFDGCTFPGKTEPLFRVQPGHMDLGLGIHGEPGIRTMQWIPARELAAVLLEPLLAERPEATDHPNRAAVILNGLGATKYE